MFCIRQLVLMIDKSKIRQYKVSLKYAADSTQWFNSSHIQDVNEQHNLML